MVAEAGWLLPRALFGGSHRARVFENHNGELL